MGDEEDEEECSYCGSTPAAPFDFLVDAITEAIAREYTDPAEELPYESAEGGYQGVFYDGYELVQEMEEWTRDDNLREDVAEALVGTAWCQRQYFTLTEGEALRYGWEDFVDAVKHRTRYLFLLDRGSDKHPTGDEIPPALMLEELRKVFKDLASESFVALPEQTKLFRARVHDRDQRLKSVADLGPPTKENARLSNRMSPAGISMFYAAFDATTAIAETFDPYRGPDNKVLSIATFRTTTPLRVLDLTILPETPSQFDEDKWHLRAPIGFLHEFVSDLTRPVKRDGYEHVEYVPTQVVTEYVRHHMTDADANRIDGMIYRSARQLGRNAIVLFIGPDECGPRESAPPESPRLELPRPTPAVLLETVEPVEPANFSTLLRT